MRQRRPLRYALPGMLLRGGLPLALFVASCSSGTGSSGNDGATPLPSTPPTPQTSPAPRVTGAALVVVAHASKAPTARFQELDLAPTLARGAAPDRGQSFELPMVQHPWSTDRFQVLASQDGADLVVGSLRIGSGHTLVHRVLGRSDAREVELGASAPAAVLVSNGTTYVGTGDRVGYVDLREAAPRFTQVHQRTLYERKAFDRIARRRPRRAHRRRAGRSLRGISADPAAVDAEQARDRPARRQHAPRHRYPLARCALHELGALKSSACFRASTGVPAARSHPSDRVTRLRLGASGGAPRPACAAARRCGGPAPETRPRAGRSGRGWTPGSRPRAGR